MAIYTLLHLNTNNPIQQKLFQFTLLPTVIKNIFLIDWLTDWLTESLVRDSICLSRSLLIVKFSFLYSNAVL